MNSLKNRINLKKLQIPKTLSKEEPDNINQPNEITPSKNTISQITENIYISGYIIGQNISYLKANNFTHVINCCLGSSLNDNNQEQEALKQLYERNNIRYLSLLLRDDPDADIFYHFFQIINFLESNTFKENKKILFHCIEGKSRAPEMVAGYLMWKNKYKFNDVIELIKEKRNCIDINLGFNIQLNKWENHLLTIKKNKKIFKVVNPSQNAIVLMKE